MFLSWKLDIQSFKVNKFKENLMSGNTDYAENGDTYLNAVALWSKYAVSIL